MGHLDVERIYDEIVFLSDTEREILFERIRRNFYRDTEAVAYTIDGEALTGEQYRTRVNVGIEQCMNGESISLEDLSKELGYDYEEL